MIPAYNCARFLAETLASVLMQDPGPENMQIAVVDDCSSDDPKSVVTKVGKGRVEFYRNERNLGAPATFNRCIQYARGQWIHILHGDDLVRAGFYQKFRLVAESHPELGAIFCRCIVVNERGHWLEISPLEAEAPGVIADFLRRIAVANRIMTPAVVVSRKAYDRLGGFNTDLIHTADWDMWKRIACSFPIWFEPEPLACWRLHGSNDTLRLVSAGTNLHDLKKAIATARTYLPSPHAKVWTRRSRAVHAQAALQTARAMLAEGSFRGAWSQMRGALALDPTPRTALLALVMIASSAFRTLVPAGYRDAS